MKTANEILKELAECENPVTVSSLKSIAISKLKQERDALIGGIEKEREACAQVADGWNKTRPETNYGHCIAIEIRARGEL